MKVEGKVAIVTGAASGMGAAEARLLAAEGASVVITDLNGPDGQALADEIGPSAVFVKHDVSDEAGWQTVADTAIERFGKIDILINNAGMPGDNGVQDTDTAQMRRVIEVNLMGSYFGMRAVIEPMKRAGGGVIVNIASGLSVVSLPGYFSYGTSKWAVRGMTRLAARDLAPFNIRVMTVVPCAIETPLLVPSVRDAAAKMMPMGRVGTAEEFAQTVLFTVSDAASYLSGSEIMVDGAFLS